MPSVKWVSDEFGSGLAIEQIECGQTFPDIGQL